MLNPVAAGICSHPADFQWRSYGETAGIAPATGLLAPELLLRTLADDVTLASLHHREIVDDASCPARPPTG